MLGRWRHDDLQRIERRYARRRLFGPARRRSHRLLLWTALGLTAWGSVSVALML